jgi:hypothetical protein
LLLLLSLQFTLRQPGDYLLSQLDLCCPRLRQLHMPGLAIDGRGIQLAAGAAARITAAAAAAAAAAGDDGDDDVASDAVFFGVSGLRSLQRLELCATQMMRSTVSGFTTLVQGSRK